MLTRFECLDACGAILGEHGLGAVALKGSYVSGSRLTLQATSQHDAPCFVEHPFSKGQDWFDSYCGTPPMNVDNPGWKAIDVSADECLGRTGKIRSDDAYTGPVSYTHLTLP